MFLAERSQNLQSFQCSIVFEPVTVPGADEAGSASEVASVSLASSTAADTAIVGAGPHIAVRPTHVHGATL